MSGIIKVDIKLLLFIIILSLFFVCFISCRNRGCNTTRFIKFIGGKENDYGKSVIQTKDRGYIIAGGTISYGNGKGDVYLLKTNACGDVVWYKTFGGKEPDFGNACRITSDGGIIIAGTTSSFGQVPPNVYLIKTDESGGEQWSHAYESNSNDYAISIEQTNDGGYIIVGSTNKDHEAKRKDIYLMKTDNPGNVSWEKTYGAGNDDTGTSVKQTPDNGYIITGYTIKSETGSFSDVILLKTDEYGNVAWKKEYGGIDEDVGMSVQYTDDGGYFITGFTSSFGAGKYDMYCIKTDVSGTELWSRTYGNKGWQKGTSGIQTRDAGYIITGRWETGIGLVKIDSYGNEMWTKNITLKNNAIYFGESIQQTKDNGYIITANLFSGLNADICLIKVDSQGNHSY
jgi:hypothetical protein